MLRGSRFAISRRRPIPPYQTYVRGVRAVRSRHGVVRAVHNTVRRRFFHSHENFDEKSYGEDAPRPPRPRTRRHHNRRERPPTLSVTGSDGRVRRLPRRPRGEQSDIELLEEASRQFEESKGVKLLKFTQRLDSPRSSVLTFDDDLDEGVEFNHRAPSWYIDSNEVSSLIATTQDAPPVFLDEETWDNLDWFLKGDNRDLTKVLRERLRPVEVESDDIVHDAILERSDMFDTDPRARKRKLTSRANVDAAAKEMMSFLGGLQSVSDGVKAEQGKREMIAARVRKALHALGRDDTRFDIDEQTTMSIFRLSIDSDVFDPQVYVDVIEALNRCRGSLALVFEVDDALANYPSLYVSETLEAMLIVCLDRLRESVWTYSRYRDRIVQIVEFVANAKFQAHPMLVHIVIQIWAEFSRTKKTRHAQLYEFALQTARNAFRRRVGLVCAESCNGKQSEMFRDSVLSLVRHTCKHHDPDEALTLYRQFVRSGFDEDVMCMRTHMYVIAHLGDLKAATQLFERMRSRKDIWEGHAYSSMIFYLGFNGMVNEALALVLAVQVRNVEVSTTAIASVAISLARSGAPEKAEALLQAVGADGGSTVKIDHAVYGALLLSYARKGDVVSMHRVFIMVPHSDEDCEEYNTSPPPSSFYINALKAGALARDEKFVTRIQNVAFVDGVCLFEDDYVGLSNALIYALSVVDRPRRAYFIYLRVHKVYRSGHRVVINGRTLSHMIESILRGDSGDKYFAAEAVYLRETSRGIKFAPPVMLHLLHAAREVSEEGVNYFYNELARWRPDESLPVEFAEQWNAMIDLIVSKEDRMRALGGVIQEQ